MAQDDKYIKQLILHIENIVGRKILSPRDFDFLARQLEGFTGERISISTLKRIWGYTQTNCGFSQHSLDLLVRMAGYTCWNTFCDDKSEIPTSQFFINQKVFSYALEVGEKMKLTWMLDRVVHRVPRKQQICCTDITEQQTSGWRHLPLRTIHGKRASCHDASHT